MTMKNTGQIYQSQRHDEMFPDIKVSRLYNGKRFIYDARKGRDPTTPVAMILDKGTGASHKLIAKNKIIRKSLILDNLLQYAQEHLLSK